MPNAQTNFWLKLLETGENPEDRLNHWTEYIFWKVPKHLLSAYEDDIGSPRLDSPRKAEVRKQLIQFVDQHGGHPPFPVLSDPNRSAYMDFSGRRMEGVSFNDRVLVNACFNGCTFTGTTEFKSVKFIGTVCFDEAVFEGVVRFDGATFLNTAYFKKTEFQDIAVFNLTTFKVSAYFQGAQFQPVIDPKTSTEPGTGFGKAVFKGETRFEDATFHGPSWFEDATFQDSTSFKNTTFTGSASFERATFSRKVGFSKADFRKLINFNNAHFEATTSFDCTMFTQPPRFFETQLHEDTDFGGVDWSRPETHYAPGWWKSIAAWWRTPSVPPDIDDAIRAWDRLALIMSKLEKHPERHTFYRLRMRAQRWKDGGGLLALANGMFDWSSDYGWSVPRALLIWFCHLFFGAAVLFFDTSSAFRCSAWQWDHAMYGSALTSFANAHAFLGLASDGGYLYSARESLQVCNPDGWIRSAVGTVQAVVGPIILFLVFLTLRNRFRLG